MKTKAPPVPPEHHRTKIRHRTGDGTFKSPPASQRTSQKKPTDPGIAGTMAGDDDITPTSGPCGAEDSAFNGGDEE
jgi:hypothetical protein